MRAPAARGAGQGLTPPPRPALPPSAAAVPSPLPRQESRIHVPRVRNVSDYHRNVEVLKPVPTFSSIPGGSLAAPYLRWHPPLPGMYDDTQPPEYDVDEADEAWLDKANAAAAAGDDGDGAGGRGGGARGGLMAAARGLVATLSNSFRSRSMSDAGGAPPEPADAAGGGAGGPLGVTDFERAIEKLELLHFAAVGKWWSDLNDGGWAGGRGRGWARGRAGRRAGAAARPHPLNVFTTSPRPPPPPNPLPGPSTSAPTQAPKIPATKQLLPKTHALEELSELVPDRRMAGQLYDHWLKRRQQHGGPLLERLWFEVRRGEGAPAVGLLSRALVHALCCGLRASGLELALRPACAAAAPRSPAPPGALEVCGVCPPARGRRGRRRDAAVHGQRVAQRQAPRGRAAAGQRRRRA
jgi:hypothetical protein